MVSGKIYIGSSCAIKSRMKRHVLELKKTTHANKHLQCAWNKYGEIAFNIEIIEECDVDLLLLREEYWMNYYGSMDENTGYNQESPQRRSYCSEDLRKRISAALSGKNHPNYGKKFSPERIARSLANKKPKIWTPEMRAECIKRFIGKDTSIYGRPITPERRLKMVAGFKAYVEKGCWNKGKKQPVELIKRLSLMRKGRKISDYQKQKLREANLGRKLSEDHKRKIGDANRGNHPYNFGRPLPIAHRLKISEALKERNMRQVRHIAI